MIQKENFWSDQESAQLLIKEKDVSLFSLEIEFLEDISFSKLWCKNITDKTKETIWKYFQTFSLITINLKSSEELQNALTAIQKDEFTKEDIKDNKFLMDMYMILVSGNRKMSPKMIGAVQKAMTNPMYDTVKRIE